MNHEMILFLCIAFPASLVFNLLQFLAWVDNKHAYESVVDENVELKKSVSTRRMALRTIAERAKSAI